MAIDYTTTAVLSNVRFKTSLDGTETDYTDARILKFCNEAQNKYITPAILSANADFFLTYEDVSLVSSRRVYQIPYRSYNATIHSIHWLNSDKTQKQFVGFVDIRNILLDEEGQPTRHIIRDNTIELSTSPTSSDEYLRIYYQYQPGQLVIESDAFEVTSKLQLGGTYRLTGNNSVIAGWSTSTDLFDITSARPPFNILHKGLTADTISSPTDVWFDEDDVDITLLAASNLYVNIEGYTCIPMFPYPFHAILEDLASVPILKALGDDDWQAMQSEAFRALKTAVSTLIPSRKRTEIKPTFRGASFMNSRLRRRL